MVAHSIPDIPVTDPVDNGRAAHGRSTLRPLGERLLDAGLITQPQLDLALSEQKRQRKKLGQVLVDLGFVSAQVIAETVASESNTRVVDLEKVVIDDEVLKLIDREVASEHRVLPLGLDNDILTVVLADAFNVVAIDKIERSTGHTIEVVTAPESRILEAIARHYEQTRSITDTIELITQRVDQIDDENADTSPLIRLVDQIIATGIKTGATDIHVEPDEKVVRLRLRVDGVLRQEAILPKQVQAALTARVKLLAELDITEKRIPQDGRIRFVFGQTKVDLRISTLPTNHGESIVMRILDGGRASMKLEDLGYTEQDQARVKALVSQPHGMILVTGPTGSGKTTTLYSALQLINGAEKSIFTLEDPIEYSMPMVRQTQVKPDLGMDFGAGLRALLRQDPDVILVGEIRDEETAQLAARASLTGHLLLSTLHTNDAAGVIPRLIDMGIERYLLPSVLAAVIAQRLVRKVCQTCRELKPLPERLASHELVGDLLSSATEIWQANGCDDCGNTGYRGRLSVYEILEIKDEVKAPIASGAPISEVAEAAVRSGMKTMLMDGIEKAQAGQTTVEEILRVTR